MSLVRLAIFVLFATYFCSCGTQKKVPINYIQNADSAINPNVQISEIKIQKNDLISIQVYSATLDPAVDAIFNLPGSGASAAASAGTGSGGTGSSGGGYLVDEKGDIEYPRFGTIHVDGLTKTQVSDIIKGKLTSPVELLKNPSVVIRFLNFKVTLLGEVARPGSITIPTGHITILEAVGLAGDIPLTGKKNTVRVLRETDGKREVGYIDLTSKDIFNSPYYNLVQNDVVFVEPTKVRIKQGDQLTLQRITTVLGIITSLTLIYNIVTR